MHLRFFFKLLVKRVVKYLPNKDKLTRKITRELNEGLFNDVDAIFFLIFFMKAYVIDTHSNCLNKSRQFK